MDKDGGTVRTTQSQIFLNNMLSELNLVDIWRKQNPKTRQYTWSQTRPLVKCRLDYFLVKKGEEKQVVETKILPTIKTDHKAIEIHVQIESNERGPGLWKINNEILKDDEYKERTRKLISDIWMRSDFNTTVSKYEYLKYELRKNTQKHCKMKAKERNLRERELCTTFENLERKLANNLITQNEMSLYIETKNALDTLYEEKARGEWIRSRLEHIEQFEKSSAYFHSTAKENYQKKTLTKITKEDNRDITNSKDIPSELFSFYSNLYTSKLPNSTNQNYQLKDSIFDDMPKMSDAEKDGMNGRISLTECSKALQDFKCNKTPGSDGLSIEFYRTFWKEMGPILVEVYNSCKDKNILTTSQRRGVIAILHKTGKDNTKIANYRPISLLNNDYKILTKVLALRISKQIDSLISSDQSGFLKGRYIGETIRKVSDIIEYCNSHKTPGYIIQLDFEKAFDSVEWEFLRDVLKKFNFSDEMQEWITMCYNDIESCVLNGGFTTKSFKLQRGFRQGCPLSSYLFLLCIEVLAHYIRKTNKIIGLKIGTTEQKLAMFADDLTCLVQDKTSIAELEKALENFQFLSGLKINYSKSTIYSVDQSETTNTSIASFKATQNLYLLGIEIGNDQQLKESRNITQRVDKVKAIFKRWKQRNLSLIGKIMIIKTYGLSQVTNTMMTTKIEKQHLKNIQKIFNDFLWSDKPAKVRHSTMINLRDEGGIHMLDLKCQYKATKLPWIWRILKPSSWNCVARLYFETIGGLELLLYSDFAAKTIDFLPPFYKEILLYFKEIVYTEGSGEFIIWNNSNITIKNARYSTDTGMTTALYIYMIL